MPAFEPPPPADLPVTTEIPEVKAAPDRPAATPDRSAAPSGRPDGAGEPAAESPGMTGFGPPPPADLPVTTEMPEVKAAAAPTEVHGPAGPQAPPSTSARSFEAPTRGTGRPGRSSPYAEPEVDRRDRLRTHRQAAAPAPAPAPASTSAPEAGPPTPPRHMRSARASRPEDRAVAPGRGFRVPPIAAALAPVVVVALLVVAWAVDTTVLSGQVARNVELAGQAIGGQGEDSLPDVVGGLAEELGQRPVTISVDGLPYETTAAELGLTIDEQATIDAAMDAGRDDAFFVRPFNWLTSFFSPNEVSLEYSVNEMQTAATLQVLQGADLTAPVEPTIQVNGLRSPDLAAPEEPTIQMDGPVFVAVPGQVGLGIDPAEVIDALPEAARAVEGTDDPIVVEATRAEVEPRFSDQDAQDLADRANIMTEPGLTAEADGQTAVLTPAQLRAWITPTITEAGMDLAFNTEAATGEAPALFGELGAEPRNARVELQNGTPVVVPGQNGVACCGADAGDRIWAALTGGQPTVAFEATISEPEHTTAEVEAWGITQPVGGSRAWQGGSPIDGPRPGFTTFHDCCAARVTNIQRIADLVDGAIIAPGGTFSVNGHVGQRTAANGFVLAGAIREGIHVDEIGGGVSQFATTMFNAAYFAGLDITTYQAHTEYFSRYPRGREATMGYPNPDLKIQNNTPYGMLIDTSHTGTSLTVTLYSTPYATAEQTNISEGTRGACQVVTTTRTRSFPDGTTRNDNFSATYRPGEGQTC